MSCETCEEILDPETQLPTDKVELLQDLLKVMCGVLEALGGGVTPPAYGSQTLSHSTSTGISATVVDTLAVSIKNIGGGTGTVGTEAVPLQAGDSINYRAEYDPVAKVYMLLPVIPFNATGTTFRIVQATI